MIQGWRIITIFGMIITDICSKDVIGGSFYVNPIVHQINSFMMEAPIILKPVHLFVL